MSDVIQDSGFITWTKGPAGLKTLKNALCDLSRSVWKDFLNTLSVEEIEHLQEFIKDVGNVKADQKKKEWLFKCDHKLCPILLGKLNAIRHNKKSMKSVWKTSCETVEIEEMEEIIGLFNIFGYHPKICETYYWHVANMFMLHGSERNEIPNTGPEDTDVAMVLKMMQNCTLFEIDENMLYEQVINIRNRIFHTGSYNVSEEKIKSFIGSMTELLKKVSKMPYCSEKHKNRIQSGIKELNELAERNVITISAQPDWIVIKMEALKLQEQAIQIDIRRRQDTEELKSVLKNNQGRIQEITESVEWVKKEKADLEEKLNKKISEQEELLKNVKKEKADLEEKLNKKIYGQEELLKNRNRHISEQANLLANRNRQISDQANLLANLNKKTSDQEELLKNLNKKTSDQEELIKNLNQKTSDQEELIKNLNKKISEQEKLENNTGHLAEGMSDTGAMSLLSGNIFGGHLWWYCSNCIRHSELMRFVSDLEELLKKKREVSASLKHQNRILEKSNNDLQTRLDGRELFPDTLARGLSVAIFGISMLPCSNSERRHLELRKKVSDLEELLKKEREETTGHTNQNRILEERNIYLHARLSEKEETARLRNPIRMNNLKGIP